MPLMGRPGTCTFRPRYRRPVSASPPPSHAGPSARSPIFIPAHPGTAAVDVEGDREGTLGGREEKNVEEDETGRGATRDLMVGSITQRIGRDWSRFASGQASSARHVTPGIHMPHAVQAVGSPIFPEILRKRPCKAALHGSAVRPHSNRAVLSSPPTLSRLNLRLGE